MADAEFENMEKHGGELSTASHCQMGCAGYPSGDEKCGGFDEMSAYEIISEAEVRLTSWARVCKRNGGVKKCPALHFSRLIGG